MLVAECPECREFSRFSLSAVGYPKLPLPEDLEGSLGASGLAWRCPHCGVLTAMENLVATGGSEPPKEIDPDSYYVHSPLTLVALAGPYPTQRDASVAIDALLRPVLGSVLQGIYERIGSTNPLSHDKLAGAEAEVEPGSPANPVLPPHSPKGLTVVGHRPIMDALEPSASFPERPEDYPVPPEARPAAVQRHGDRREQQAPKIRKRADRPAGLVEGALVVEHGGEETGVIQRLEDRQLKGIFAHVQWQSGESSICPLSALSPAPDSDEEEDYDRIDIGARIVGDEEIVVPDGDRADQELFLI